ncbi:magnesium transporter [Vibrio sp. UCD-FRSSP16_10]|uniref:magnesium transporter n=1 Tax=unclassified Vibrio TaxID=2614977 RepID=UPI0007FD76E0|nr:MULTISPECIES: magnesium transporter [unclassified Vibrio]OBT13387.1 magnesium transporter [Vibrio sp. UCD-FRSSP16_10]OBT17897.1 magnesium transporter [Vibrio sp. UCD-FRSSP16_30]
MKRLFGIIKWITKAAGVIGAVAVTSLFFSTLSSIHGKTMPESEFVDGNPSIINLLNSEIFMGLIFVVTLSIFAYVSYLLWQLHEVAVHESEHRKSAHTNIVFALSLCGLFISKTWWVLAIVIAFTRWDMIGNSLSRVIRRGVEKESVVTQENK